MKKVVFAKDVLYGVLAAVVQNDVLHVAWQDNNLVLALTTSYSVHEVDDTVSKKRTRPSKTSTNARIVLPAFQENGQPICSSQVVLLLYGRSGSIQCLGGCVHFPASLQLELDASFQLAFRWKSFKCFQAL